MHSADAGAGCAFPGGTRDSIRLAGAAVRVSATAAHVILKRSWGLILYYEYTCCTNGPGHGEEWCGDCCTDVGLIILITVSSFAGFAVCATCVGIAICYFAKFACFAPRPDLTILSCQQQQPGMEMVQMDQPQQGVIIQPQQQGVVIQPQHIEGCDRGPAAAGPCQGVIVQAMPTIPTKTTL